jgi:hypothetical protein
MLERVDKRMLAVAAALETLASAYESKGNEAAPVPLLALLAEPVKPAEFEVTAAIRELLSKGDRLTVPEIRDVLVEQGWKTGDYKNPLAFIHTVLKRLIKAEEVGDGEGYDGRKHYFDIRSRAEIEERDRELKATWREAAKENGAAFIEFKTLVEAPCRKILASNPRGITAKAIYRELRKAGFDMPSHWSNPAMGIARTLQGMQGVECFRSIRNDVAQNFWRLKTGNS